MTIQNPFTSRDVAKRYSAARPRVHRDALDTFREASGQREEFHCALDVACGTGQSTVALSDQSRLVVGTDISAAMLAESESRTGIEYVCGAAEYLPFGRESFDAVSVGLAFHWLRQPRFLAEANRVLVAGGWLVIYTSWFSAKMRGAADFTEGAWKRYLELFPSPPRDSRPIASDLAESHGFELCGAPEFGSWFELSVEELVEYFSTQSNIIHAVERTGIQLESAKQTVRDLVHPVFRKSRHAFWFPGQVWYMIKRSST